jgi:hypothetical protein
MPQARLHWLWGTAIAVAFGVVLGYASLPAVNTAFLFVFHRMERAVGEILALSLLIGTPAAFGGAVAYGLLTRFFGPMRPDNETRCRKCGYILRGITEPRCSECGERI